MHACVHDRRHKSALPTSVERNRPHTRADPRATGWRGETECQSNNGENDDEAEEDLSAAVWADATRQHLVSLFGEDGSRLQRSLAEWWVTEMKAVASGELPDFIKRERLLQVQRPAQRRAHNKQPHFHTLR